MTLLTAGGRSALRSITFLGLGHVQVKFKGWGVVDPPYQGLSLIIGSGARPLTKHMSTVTVSSTELQNNIEKTLFFEELH